MHLQCVCNPRVKKKRGGRTMHIFLLVVGIVLLIVGIALAIWLSELKRTKVLLIVAGLVLVLFSQSFIIIPSSKTGVMVAMGQISSEVLPSGFNWKVPFFQKITIVDNRQQRVSFKDRLWSETSQRTPVYYEAVEVTYQIPADSGYWILANVPDYEKSLIDQSLIASAVKSSSVQLTDAEATNRGKIEPLSVSNLQQLADAKYGEGRVKILAITIGNADFSDEYNEALAQKNMAEILLEQQKIDNQTALEKAEGNRKVAEIEAETEYNKQLKAAQAEADTLYLKAEKQAEANRLLAESLSDSVLRFELLNRWNGQLPKYMGNGDESFLFSMLEEPTE